MKKLIGPVLAAVMSLPAVSSTETYYDCGGGYYSDTPKHMVAGGCPVRSARNGGVVKPMETGNAASSTMSLADMQAQLNQKIAAQNKQIEDSNAKLMAETKAENCKAAQMNKETVERTNARNKGDLLPRYEADINKYCN